MIEEVILLISGLLIGIIGVIFGGSMFLSIPLWQGLFPNISYGNIIGNIKVGSFFRGIASSTKTWKEIHLKDSLTIAIPFVIFSIVGTYAISSLDQKYIIYAIVTAIFLSEFSPKIAHLINQKTKIIFSALLGLYTGFLGAGISILLVALLRTTFTKNSQIVHVKIQARFIETLGTIFVIAAHVYQGNLIFPLWLMWSIGMFFGGYIGGHVLKKTIHISAKWQRIYLIIVYAIALIPSIIKVI